MRFLSKTECEAFVGPGAVQDIAAGRMPAQLKKNVSFSYQSSLRNSLEVAEALVECLGHFKAALLWTHGLVWGDKTEDPEAPDQWAEYGRWRSSNGARAGLAHLPGHSFTYEELYDLAKAVNWTIRTGSDAIVITHPIRTVLQLSHDDVISVQSRSTPAGLRRLATLGLSRIS